MSRGGRVGRIDERLAWVEAKLGECQRTTLRYFGSRLRVERKADRSPVTIADRKIEEHLRAQISRAFPGEAIVGEEFGGSPGAARSYWTIDPIDGTRGFSRGLPSWGIMMAYVQDGRPALGACQYPAIGTFLGATPGGAYERQAGGRRIRLPRAAIPPKLNDAVLFHGGARWWQRTPYEAGFRRLIDRCFLERAYGDCYGFLWLFRGRVDAIVEYDVKLWDLAPFAAMAHATGRLMTDCAGRSSFTGPELVVAHPALVRTIVACLRAGRTFARHAPPNRQSPLA